MVFTFLLCCSYSSSPDNDSATVLHLIHRVSHITRKIAKRSLVRDSQMSNCENFLLIEFCELNLFSDLICWFGKTKDKKMAP